VPMGDYEAMEKAVTPHTVMIISESPTNPYLNIADIDELVRIARAHRVLSVIDSTFATPYNSRPLEQGVDVVIQSATKYLAGHNDILAGAAFGSAKATEPIYLWRRMTGGVTDPMSCYLLIRGLKTFGMRMERLNSTALQVAQFLEKQHQIRRVYYPGLPSHPHHQLAKKQMKGFGAVVTFEIDGNLEQTLKFWMDWFRLFLDEVGDVVDVIALVEQTTVHAVHERDRRVGSDHTFQPANRYTFFQRCYAHFVLPR